MTVLFKPFCGSLNQEQYLQLKYCPLQFELEIVSNASDPVVSKESFDYKRVNTAYTTDLVSNSWQLEQFENKM